MNNEIYIAGPDVFRPDAEAHFRRIDDQLQAHGLRARIPSDGDLSKGAPLTPETARRIFEENIVRIRSTRAMLVNLNAFRGVEPDSGSCFEVGVGFALGKLIVGYVDAPEPYFDRVKRLIGVAPHQQTGFLGDTATGCLIEQFGLPVNLMLVFSTGLVTQGLDAAIAALVAHLAEEKACA